MREAFAHDAILSVDTAADAGAPGAAITVALCGHWEHDGACPLAPHHTRVERVGRDLHVRTLFVTEPELEATVRDRINAALSRGRLQGPDAAATEWHVRSSTSAAVSAEEAEQAQRLKLS